MTTTTSSHSDQGQMVSVRSRNWMVTDVSASTLPPERLQTGLESPQHLVTLSSVEDDALGDPAEGFGALEDSPPHRRRAGTVGSCQEEVQWEVESKKSRLTSEGAMRIPQPGKGEP
jgi:hypothetical protein